MDEKIFCAVKGYKVEEHVCSGIIMKADAATIQTCRTCARGSALARTTSIEVKDIDPAAIAAAAAAHTGKIEHIDSAQQPSTANSAWELIVERTGCTSQEKLAKKIGGTYQSKVSQIMVKLGKGITPSGREWNRLLEITGLMPEELLLAAGHMPSAKAAPIADESVPTESSPGPLVNRRIAFSSQPPAPPAASSQLTPSGPAVPSPAAPEGPAGHMMRMQDAPDKEACSEAAEQMLELDESPAKGEALAEGAGSPAFTTAQVLENIDGVKRPESCAALPADFLPYTGGRPVLHGKAALHIKSSGDMELSVDAVALGNLEHAGHVRPFWSDQRKQIGFAPVEATGPGVLKLQPTPSKRRRISASGFLNGFDIRPKPGTYPMECHPSGLLVATITQQPAKGGEA